MTDEFNLVPTSNLEKHLDNILRAASGESVTDELVPQWDDEKFLDDILKAATGDSPQYNLDPSWRHQWWLSQIAKKLAEGGGGAVEYEEGTFTPEEDVAQPVITFSKDHESYVNIVIVGDVANETPYTQYQIEQLIAVRYPGETAVSTVLSQGYCTYASSTTAVKQAKGYMLWTTGEFGKVQIGGANTNYKFLAGHTYKWFALWLDTLTES